jgi:hypothetical protein
VVRAKDHLFPLAVRLVKKWLYTNNKRPKQVFKHTIR